MFYSSSCSRQVGQSARQEAKTRRRPGPRLLAGAATVLLVAGLTGGCSAVLSAGAPLSKDVGERSAEISIHGESLTLHLASPQVPPSAATPLVLYASGDGGWFGAAVGMFHTIASSGYPTVGFSSKELMGIEHKRSKPLALAHLAEDYRQIIDAARAQLRLPPETPVVLTGWSRGASLGVLAASRLDADSGVVGVVAIGLAAEEHLDVDSDTDEDVDPAAVVSARAHAPSIALYPLLSTLTPLRVVVLQASGDSYLPAARARELFGSDTAATRLVVIDAHNHRFNGGESDFAAALIEAVGWVASGGK